MQNKGPVRVGPSIPISKDQYPNIPISKDQYPNIPISKDQYPNIPFSNDQDAAYRPKVNVDGEDLYITVIVLQHSHSTLDWYSGDLLDNIQVAYAIC